MNQKRKVKAEEGILTKELFPGAILFGPLPAVLVTSINEMGQANVFTVSWTGVVCTKPPMVSIAVRKERLSYENIRASGEFVINLTSREMLKMTDFCGCRSGRKIDKIKHLGLALHPGVEVAVPSLEKSPVALECSVRSVIELGSHDLFVADVVRNKVDKTLIDSKGRICMDRSQLLAYCHGEYFSLPRRPIGTFGYSVAKKATRQAKHKKNLYRKKRR
jgi:flavin reductase (DIM6/NTAB) family NADH-FMN oxidoreductase RutF